MASNTDVLKRGLGKLNNAPTDEAEDALESLNRKSPEGRKVNKVYHEQMPKAELKADIKEDLKEPQTKAKKADIKEDIKALKAREFSGGGIQPKGTVYKPNPKGPQN